MRVALFQMEDRGSIKENIEAARKAILSCNADFICFPEFFTIPADYKKRGKNLEDAWREVTVPTLQMLTEASRNFLGYIVGGSVVEKDGNDYYNTCFIFRKGRVLAKYRKMSPIEEELKMGIKPGNDTVSLDTEFGRVGVIICADCLNERVVDSIARRCDLLFLPISMTDPAHPAVEGHPVSKKIAEKYGIMVAKVSRIVRGMGVRSAVISPNGIVKEAGSSGEEMLVVSLR